MISTEARQKSRAQEPQMGRTDPPRNESRTSAPPGVVTWAEINLDAIAHNTACAKRWVGEETEIIAVIKANAYGHGEVPVAETVLRAGATRLAVHRTVDGVRLREAGVTAPILILGYTPASGIPMVIEHDLTPTVIDREIAERLARTATHPVPIHIKVDTGMSRYGLFPEEVVDFVRFVKTLPNVEPEGLFSHFATADESDRGPMLAQWRRFQEVLRALEAAGIEIPLRHICNSAGVLALPEAHLDAVRPGILLYGLNPSSAVRAPFELRPALALKSLVVRVRALPPGSAIGYGRAYITQEPMVAALVPIGYGDGYHRLLSNRGEVLVHGRRAPVRGRVSMDQIVVDVSAIPDVRVGDEVVVIGEQGDAQISAEEIAAWAETINYEVLTALHPQVVRAYRQNGHVLVCGDGRPLLWRNGEEG
ncbi:MAG: alanine racemase [Anaerolineales bacterium]